MTSSTSSTNELRIVYIVSAYQLPHQLTRLVNRLDRPGCHFLVHVDRKSPPEVAQTLERELGGRPNVRFLDRHDCYWGDFGHVLVSLKGIRTVLECQIPADYVVLLTGQCYPIKGNSAISDFLQFHSGRQLLRCVPFPVNGWWNGGRERIERYHFRAMGRSMSFPLSRKPVPGVIGDLLVRLTNLVPWRRRIPSGVQPYGGNSYWCLTASCAAYIQSFVDAHPEFVKFFKHVAMPDEIFFHTILGNSPFADTIEQFEVHYVDWSKRRAGSPGILTVDDFAQLADSPKLFARKFDARVDAEILDRIDQELLPRNVDLGRWFGSETVNEAECLTSLSP